MIDLEARVKELETKNAELEERLSTLQNENQMLRQVLNSSFMFDRFVDATLGEVNRVLVASNNPC